MPDMGSTEVTYLWASAVLGVVYLVASLIVSVSARGMTWGVGPRDEPLPTIGKMGGRIERAWRNFTETFPLFAAAVLVEVSVTGGNSSLAAIGAQLYFWGRVAFLPAYAIGVPFIRTLIWTVSLVGILLVLWACLPSA